MVIESLSRKRSSGRESSHGAGARPLFVQNFLKTWIASYIVKIGYVSSQFSVPIYEVIEREFDLGRAEFMVLQCLHHTPALTATDIKSLTKQPKNSVSWGIKRLVERGLISRVPDLEDGRRVVLKLSADGSRICRRVLPMIGARQEALMSCLTKAERSQLAHILDKLVQDVVNLPHPSLGRPSRDPSADTRGAGRPIAQSAPGARRRGANKIG